MFDSESEDDVQLKGSEKVGAWLITPVSGSMRPLRLTQQCYPAACVQGEKLVINKAFAKRYEASKKKQELSRLREVLGE